MQKSRACDLVETAFWFRLRLHHLHSTYDLEKTTGQFNKPFYKRNFTSVAIVLKSENNSHTCKLHL